MPELPEVETVRRGLEEKLVKFHIARIEVLKDRSVASPGGVEEFISKIQGTNFGIWNRRGKYLINTLQGEEQSYQDKTNDFNKYGSLCIHLRMTGHFKFYKNKCSPCPYTRVRFWDTNGIELRFIDMRNFGQMWWIPPGKSPQEIIGGLKKLGPEPFSKEFNTLYLKTKLRDKTCAIKVSLLNQSIFAGTGNIYADESLFAAGIIPTKRSGDLKDSEIDRLRENLIKILKSSIGKGGTTFKDFRDLEGKDGNYGTQANVYKREGLPCKKCGSVIQRMKISGRSSHWCPQCQK